MYIIIIIIIINNFIRKHIITIHMMHRQNYSTLVMPLASYTGLKPVHLEHILHHL